MEKALLITVDLKDKNDSWTAEERAGELSELAASSGALVIKNLIVKRDKPSPDLFIGKGKAEEAEGVCREEGIKVIIFNNDLTGTQQKNLEDIIGVKVVDRTQLILDIFARRAHSGEGKLQVELAQLIYLMPRLSGQGILLSRTGGGIGTRGPGEQKLEADRRKIRDRIAKLKGDLDKLHVQRATRRKQRSKFSILNIAIIGYTNSGKSTLLNALTNSKVYVKDKLFSTLDPTIRSLLLPNNQKVLLADTVGFLDRLPHNLIESFKATLEEVVNSDMLIHVIDVSSPKAKEMEKAVFSVLAELGLQDKKIITVLNKTDKITEADIRGKQRDFPESVAVSALNGSNLETLIDAITLYLNNVIKTYRFTLRQDQAKLINLVYERGNVVKRDYEGDLLTLEAQLPSAVWEKIRKEIA